ncbi:MAG: AtpZ/AtpI family protein [Fusobacteriaceae bacterium]
MKNKNDRNWKGWIIFDKEVVKSFSLLGYIGFLFVGNLLLFIFLYKLIAKFFGESSVLFIVFLVIGIGSGLYSVYKVITKK